MKIDKNNVLTFLDTLRTSETKQLSTTMDCVLALSEVCKELDERIKALEKV